MSEAKPFSLAVLKGANKGAVLRTVRKRISVGRADDNDLVLTDPSISPRHFLVLIDADRWRIHTLSAENRITVDRRWAHPATGRRGALINTGEAELLLFPGTLDDGVVEEEIQRRETGAFVLPTTNEELVTSVHAQPVEFRSDMRPSTVAATAEEMTLDRDPPNKPDDLIELSQMATIAGDRPPDDLRDAARSKIQGERHPVAPSVLRETSIENVSVQTVLPPVEDPFEERTIGVRWENGKPVPMPISAAQKPPRKKRSQGAWDRSKKPDIEPARSNAIPEVLAQPESQMREMPGAGKSMMSARPDFAVGGSVSKPAEVIEFKPKAKPTSNAWGDRPTTSPPPAAPEPRSNAWGDPSENAIATREEAKPRNAWGDTVKPQDEPTPTPAPKRTRNNAWGDSARPTTGGSAGAAVSGRRSIQKQQNGAITAGVRRTIQEIASTASNDPATRILREPDGQFATSMRLLAARIEDFAKNLGYRAYMFSSSEPLTGKTTCAMNLAFALAEDTHRRIALMEADFRFPRFAELLGIDERQGVLGVVEGRAELAQSIVKVADRNLVILPAGGRHPHPGEVLASPRFKALIAELVNTVDIAILDAPSVMPFADTNLLLPLVDAAFLVVANDVTSTSALAAARSQLGDNRILGALYNHLPKKTDKALKKERKGRIRQR